MIAPAFSNNILYFNVVHYVYTIETDLPEILVLQRNYEIEREKYLQLIRAIRRHIFFFAFD